MTQDDSDAGSLERVSLFAGRLKEILGFVTAALAAAIAVLAFFYPFGDLHLSVHLRSEVRVTLPEDSADLPLAMSYEGKPIESASLLDLRIENVGKEPLGEEGKRWHLDLLSNVGPTMTVVGALETDPDGIEVDLKSPASASGQLTLGIGILNPKEAIELKLLVVDPSGDARLPIDSNARMRGLPKPEPDRNSLDKIVANAYRPPLAVFFFVGFLAAAVWEFIKKRDYSGRGWRPLLLAPLLALVASAVLGNWVATGFAHVALWFFR